MSQNIPRQSPIGNGITPVQDWAILILAIWLFISPWVLNFSGVAPPADAGSTAQAVSHTAAWNAWVLGVIIAAVSASALAGRKELWPEWGLAALGVWVFIAPWVLGSFSRVAAWDHWIVGGLIFIIAALSISRIWALRGAPVTTSEAGELRYRR